MSGEASDGVGLEVVLATHRGVVRSTNQDAIGFGDWILTAREGGPLALRVEPPALGQMIAVADGMGGHRGGAEASRGALAALASAGGDLEAAVAVAAEALRARGAAEPSLEGMGTTLVGVRISPDGAATFFNVGDSRAYQVVDGYLGQVSVDDRPAGNLEHNRGVITQYVGGTRVVALDPHLHQTTLTPGDRVLLCSDGLHDMVSEARIAELVQLPLHQAATALLAEALQCGGQDNVSLVLIDVTDRQR